MFASKDPNHYINGFPKKASTYNLFNTLLPEIKHSLLKKYKQTLITTTPLLDDLFSILFHLLQHIHKTDTIYNKKKPSSLTLLFNINEELENEISKLFNNIILTKKQYINNIITAHNEISFQITSHIINNKKHSLTITNESFNYLKEFTLKEDILMKYKYNKEHYSSKLKLALLSPEYSFNKNKDVRTECNYSHSAKKKTMSQPKVYSNHIYKDDLSTRSNYDKQLKINNSNYQKSLTYTINQSVPKSSYYIKNYLNKNKELIMKYNDTVKKSSRSNSQKT
jgi:hypothetical protein